MSNNGKNIDFAGQRFNKLLVISKSSTAYKWVCMCDCGNKKEINIYSLLKGVTKSCGCLSIEKAKGRATHGKSRTTEHNIWKTIKQRCYNKNLDSYKRYGARGIKMSLRWKNSFSAFLEDMGDRPSLKHSIERIDNNKEYCKSNCRWATMKEQCLNRRNSVFITINGETKRMSEWCEGAGITISTAYCRINRKWRYEKIFSTPIIKKDEVGVRYKYKGQEMNLYGWSKKIKISIPTIRQRLKRGYSIADAFTKKADKKRL